MNERIKQLAEQARKHFPGTETSGEYWVFDEQLFAELIVRECAKIGDNYQDILEDDPECFNCRKVAYGIVDKIKKHFGVEDRAVPILSADEQALLFNINQRGLCPLLIRFAGITSSGLYTIEATKKAFGVTE